MSSKNFITRNKASVTVETTIIISTIIFILMVLVFSFMLMYQKALLAKTATKVAQQGAEIWVDSRKQIETGSYSEEESDSLYYRIFNDALITGKKFSVTINSLAQYKELLSHETEKENIQEKKFLKMKKLILSELSRGILKPSKTTVEIEFSNVIQRKIEVKLSQNIKIPIDFFIKFFGKRESFDLSSKGVAIVSEPSENIRNIDLGLEYFEKFKKGIDYEELKKKLKGSK